MSTLERWQKGIEDREAKTEEVSIYVWTEVDKDKKEERLVGEIVLKNSNESQEIKIPYTFNGRRQSGPYYPIDLTLTVNGEEIRLLGSSTTQNLNAPIPKKVEIIWELFYPYFLQNMRLLFFAQASTTDRIKEFSESGSEIGKKNKEEPKKIPIKDYKILFDS